MADGSELERVERARKAPRRAIGLIVVGLVGLMSFRPIWDHNWGPRGAEWLPFNGLAVWVGLAIWVAFLATGIYGVAESVRAGREQSSSSEQAGQRREIAVYDAGLESPGEHNRA